MRWLRGLAAGLALAAAFFVVAFFLVCLGVIIPKHVAAKSPIRFCYKALSVVEWAIKLLSPFTWLISVAAFVVLKAVGIDIRSSNEKVTEEDIMYMVNEGHDQGVLEASEAEMITNIFEFDDKVASGYHDPQKECGGPGKHHDLKGNGGFHRKRGQQFQASRSTRRISTIS